MLIIGTGGLGKEILGILIQDNFPDEVIFWDENPHGASQIYHKYIVYKSIDEVADYFSRGDNRFVAGIGNPRIREKMINKAEAAGGKLVSVISERANIFQYNSRYEGIIVQPGAGISHNVEIGKGSVIHINSTIGHSTRIGRFVNIGPNASIVGPAEIGDYAYISVQAVVLPGIRIGKHAYVTAGRVADRNIEDYETY